MQRAKIIPPLPSRASWYSNGGTVAQPYTLRVVLLSQKPTEHIYIEHKRRGRERSKTGGITAFLQCRSERGGRMVALFYSGAATYFLSLFFPFLRRLGSLVVVVGAAEGHMREDGRGLKWSSDSRG